MPTTKKKSRENVEKVEKMSRKRRELVENVLENGEISQNSPPPPTKTKKNKIAGVKDYIPTSQVSTFTYPFARREDLPRIKIN